ncbi:MAG TPA: 4a-hydroxytetrahydrobiopterin dehydratase [Thermoanaerobaculia bacterium]|nr:4a-hydroxytetrahydrobiopterin dehydratase [Thermoanaerobaculia bacterium]
MKTTSVERPRTLAFLSYRRDDSRDWANLIADTLQRNFGRNCVFIDTDGIRVGDQWSRKIETALEYATVVMPIIGPRWLFLQSPDDGRRRLDSENDWVRREIEYALQEEKEIVPITVSGAPIPAPQQLPESIRDLPSRQALKISDKRDVEVIVGYLADRLGFKRIKAELDFPTPVDRTPEVGEAELAEALAHLPGWEVEQRDSQRGREGTAAELVTTLKFDQFEDAMHFMATASRYISRTDHHPFWENQYKDIRIRISTWDIGLRISPKDIKLANYLQWLYRDYTPGERPDMNYTT